VQRTTALRFSYQDLRQPVFSRRFLAMELQRERRLLLFDRRAETHLLTPVSLIPILCKGFLNASRGISWGGGQPAGLAAAQKESS